MKRALLLLVVAGCGYTAGGPVRSISVAPVVEPGVDVDAAALLGAAVRHAVARGPGTRLSSDGADGRLEIELLGATSGLQSFADPGARAAQYRAVMNVRATLVDAGGRVVWRSEVISGEAPFLSAPGPIERLEGARRRALERAAEDAAERLVASLRWRE